jgi:N-carbamoylputrescine amidase
MIIWNVLFSILSTAICWDQWFPEAARALALQGAELLLYPTAIGSEPQDSGLDSCEHWKRVMQGHAGANLVLSLCVISFCFLYSHESMSSSTIPDCI